MEKYRLHERINSKKINILDKKPLNGGIPAIEKKTTIKENDQRGFRLKKLEILDNNKEFTF